MPALDPLFVLCAACVILPLLSFGGIMIFTWRRPFLSLAVSLTASTACLFIAWYIFWQRWGDPTPLVLNVDWLVSDLVRVPFGFLLDPVSQLMLVLVATISFLIQIYSIGYMWGDPGFGRYYADLSLFAMAMLGLVISSGLLQLFICWELVGLASYLLIGFWYEKFSASEAGKKAFVVTRFGDIFFFMGLALLVIFYGSLDIASINAAALAQKMEPWLITTCALLIFGGICGKSAQFPIHVWLPDAMEGPTPVSALLHSATMVAAGVYLLTRIFPFFAASAPAMTYVLAVASLTYVLSSTVGMVARDIKQVWAYSTISQLAMMAMGLAAAGLAHGTLFAGYFHLTTHAGFKALLFLCAGAFIHHYGTNSFFMMSKGGAKKLTIPMVTVTIGALALAGIFPFSGFFSKELILGNLWHLDNKLWVAIGLLGAFLTAYYTFRVIFVLLFPRPEDHPAWEKYYEPVAGGHGHGHEEEKEAHGHGHGGHGGDFPGHAPEWAINLPLIVLAGITIVLGFLQGTLERFLLGESHPHEMNYRLLVLAVGLALAGIGLAWWDWGRKGAAWEGFLSKVPALEHFFIQKWYMDHFWRWFLNAVIYNIFSKTFTYNDRRVVDGGVDAVALGCIGSGRFLSFLQTALLQLNLLFMVLVLAGVGIYLLMGR